MAMKLARVLQVFVILGLAPLTHAADTEVATGIAVCGPFPIDSKTGQNPLRNGTVTGISSSAEREAVIAASASTPDMSASNADSMSMGPETTVAASANTSEYFAQSGGETGEAWRSEPGWKAAGGALFFWRTSTRGPELLSDPVAGSLLRSANLSFDCDAGPRISLMRTGCDWDLELNYFGITGWQSDAAFPNSALPNGIGIVALDKTIPFPITAATFEDTSSLYSSEINLRRQIWPRLTILAGFRWMELDDTYGVGGTDAILSSPFSETIRAHNQLFGFQSGVEAVVLKDEHFQISAIVKTGLFYDVVSQNTTFSNPAGLGTLTASADGNHAAFVGEIGLMATQQIYKNTVIRGGYEALFLDGVALGPRQIPATDLTAGTASIETGGGLVFHGISVTLEVNW
jgi:hypothetical protein